MSQELMFYGTTPSDRFLTVVGEKAHLADSSTATVYLEFYH